MTKRWDIVMDEKYQELMDKIQELTESIDNNNGEDKSVEYFERGFAYGKVKEYQKAIDDLTQVIKINPDYGNTYISRGAVYDEMGEYAEAIQDYTQAIKIDPNDEYSYFFRGISYHNMEDYSAAIQDYTEAIKINPNYENAYFNRGFLYYEMGDYPSVIQDYTEAIKINLDNENAYFFRGVSHYELGDHSSAIQDYTEAIKINPNYENAYLGRGVSHYKMADYSSAILDYTEAIKIKPNDESLYYRRGLAYVGQKNNSNAIVDFDKAIEIDPDYEPAIIARAGILSNNEGNNFPTSSSNDMIGKYIDSTIDGEDLKKKLKYLHNLTTALKGFCKYSENKSDSIAHYTKIENIKHLFYTKEKIEKDKAPHIRMNNSIYMNDPTEGLVFNEHFSEGGAKEIIDLLYGEHDKDSRRVISKNNYVFLVSFSKAVDTSLPMWLQYSDDGKGCGLCFKSSFFETSLPTMDGEKKGEDYYLYEVNYDFKDPKIIEFMDKIQGHLCDIYKVIKPLDAEKKNKACDVLRTILDQVRFLFKSSDYQHEQELRVIRFQKDNIQVDDAPYNVVPKLYIDLDKNLPYNDMEVILGPKVYKPVEVAGYLYHVGVKDVSVSKIKYR